MNMKSSALALIAALFVLSQTCTAGSSPKLINQLETISKSIGIHTDLFAVSDSLYRQVRPNVLINNKTLSPGEIDESVRAYIMKQFAPILVMHYSLQFSKMNKAGLHFGGCQALQALPFDEHTDMALCTSKTENSLDVRYLTRQGTQDWKTATVYKFSKRQHKLVLTAIQLNVKQGQKFRISDI